MRLIALHGSMSSAAQWRGYAPLLGGVDVVSPDLPGHGNRLAERFTIPRVAETIEEASAGADEFVLAGHSLGGYLAFGYAATHPERVAGLILLGASAEPTGALAATYGAFAWAVERAPRRVFTNARNSLARRMGMADDLLVPPEAYDDLGHIWASVQRACPLRLLGQVRCPVVVINGQFDQMRLHERRAARLASNAPVRIITGASHLAPITHRASVAREIQQFLAQHGLTSG